MMEGTETAAFSVSRFLLKPGRSYADAVKGFQPYTGIKEADEDARGAARKIVGRSLELNRRTYMYVNNRLEGCAPLTIDGILRSGYPLTATMKAGSLV